MVDPWAWTTEASGEAGDRILCIETMFLCSLWSLCSPCSLLEARENSALALDEAGGVGVTGLAVDDGLLPMVGMNGLGEGERERERGRRGQVRLGGEGWGDQGREGGGAALGVVRAWEQSGHVGFGPVRLVSCARVFCARPESRAMNGREEWTRQIRRLVPWTGDRHRRCTAWVMAWVLAWA